MKKRYTVFTVFCCAFVATKVSAQAVSVTQPLSGVVMAPAFASQNGVVISGTSAPPPGPDLRITKTPTIGANGAVTYTLFIQNLGGAAAPGPIVVYDTLLARPVGTMFTRAAGNGGFSCPPIGNALPWACRRPGSLAPGQAVTLLISIKVPMPNGGHVRNCATVKQGVGGPADVNLANNRACVDIIVP